MSRAVLLSLRFCAMATAMVVLLFATGAVHAQTGFNTPGGYNAPGYQPGSGATSRPLGQNGERDPYAYYAQPGQSANAGMAGYYDVMGATPANPAPYASDPNLSVEAQSGPQRSAAPPRYAPPQSSTSFVPAPQSGPAPAPVQPVYSQPYPAPYQGPAGAQPYGVPARLNAPAAPTPDYGIPQRLRDTAPVTSAPLPPPGSYGTPMPQGPAPGPQPATGGYVAAPATPVGYNARVPVDSGYVLGPGDKVRVTIYGEPELSGEFPIDGSGAVRLPLIGAIRAAGYTAPGLEAWILSALSPNYLRNPRINVEITTYRPIFVTGAVAKPGEYPYANNMSLQNAIAMAGGFTEQAARGAVYIRHEGSAVEEVLSADRPFLVRPGDVIRIKTSAFWDAMNFISPLAGPAAIAAAAF